MAEPYFVFNNVDSRTMGVRVVSYPPILRANLRATTVTLPGRPGELTQIEGVDIYEPYTRAMTIASAGADMQTALNWLRGSGTMILGNEPDYVYSVRLDAQLQMDKQYTNMWSGSLQMRTEPFKRTSAASSAIEVTTSGTTVNNPGNVPARPKITLTGSGSATLTIGGKTLTFTGLTSGTVVDLQNQWILVSGTPTAGIASGEFGAFPAGNSTVTFTGLTKVTIPQDWLYV